MSLRDLRDLQRILAAEIENVSALDSEEAQESLPRLEDLAIALQTEIEAAERKQA